MRFFESVNVDWIGKKNLFIGISVALMIASFVSIAARHIAIWPLAVELCLVKFGRP
jgi:hypothetical protein